MKSWSLLRSTRNLHLHITNSFRYCTILSTPQSSEDKTNNKDKSIGITDRLTGTTSSSNSYSFNNIINPLRNGIVKDITNTIATIEGFTLAKPYSIVSFDNGVRGLVLNVNKSGCKIGIIDNGKYNKLLKNNDIIRIDNVDNFDMKSPSTIVGPGIIGRIVDVFGNDFKYEYNQPYSNSSSSNIDSIENNKYLLPVYNVNIFPNNKYITHWNTYSRERQRIHTGIKSIDTFYPLAKGLRSAIIGTNIHKKSELAIDILLSFQNHNKSTDNMREKMFGIYVMIGKPIDEIWRLYNILLDSGALEYCTIIVSRNDDFMSKQLLTPYSGASIADFYKFYGMNSFIIYDDFTIHNRICSKLYRESKGLLSYGNWSGELLERSCQINNKYGNGSHSALCIADKPKDDDELNMESETFYNYLPYLISHVDQHIMLSDQSFENNLLPPISLLPVPYGIPKFMKYNHDKWNKILLKLSINVKKILFQFVELETAARHQMELNLDLEPDVERISSNVYKLQILFTQNEEINIEKLILILLSINNKIIEYIHLDKINF
eukprot:320073_1